MPNSNLENSKTNMKTRIRNRVQAGQTPRDLGRLAKSARFVGLTDDAEVETDIDTQMAAAIPTASIDELVEMSEGLKELRSGSADMGRVSTADNVTEGGNKFLKAANVQPALSVSGDLSYDSGVVSYTAPSSSALQVVATVGDLPTDASAGDQAVVQSNNKLYIRTADGWYAVALINTAPTVSGNDASYTLATDGTATVITLTAVDPENDPVSFSHSVTSGALNGTTVSQSDNVFTVTPHASQPATFELTFSADDSVNVATVVSSFTLAFALSFDYTNTTPTFLLQPNPLDKDEFGDCVVASRTGNIVVGSRWGTTQASGYDARNVELLGYDVSDLNNIQLLWTVPTTNNSVFYRDSLSTSDTHFVEILDNSRFIYVRKFSDGQIDQTIDLGTTYNGWMKKADSYCFSSDGQSLYVGYVKTMSHDELNTGKGIAVEEYEISTGNLLGTFDYPGGYTSRPSSGAHLNYGTIAVGDGWVAIGALNDGGTDQSGPSGRAQQVGRVYVFDSTTRNHIASIDSPIFTTNPVGIENHHKFGGGNHDQFTPGIHIASGNGRYLVTASRVNQGYWNNGVWTIDPEAMIHIYDLADPTNPIFKASIGNPTLPTQSFMGSRDVEGDYLYVSHYGPAARRDLSVIKISTQQVEYTRQDIGLAVSIAVTENGTIAVGDHIANAAGQSSESYSHSGENFGRIILYPANT